MVPPVGRNPAAGLGVDAGLHCVAGEHDVVLRQRQHLAAGHPDLLFHQVDTGDHLVTGCSTCRRVFISMKKKSPGRFARHDKLDRPGAGVADAAGGIAGSLPDAGAGGLVEQYRRRPRSPSDAVAAASTRVRRGGSRCRGCRREPAPRCGGGVDEMFQEQRVVTERRRRLPPRALHSRGKLGGVRDAVHFPYPRHPRSV